VQVEQVCTPCLVVGICEELGLTLEAMPLDSGFWRSLNTSIAVRLCVANEAVC